MKRLTILLCLLVAASSLAAQTISVNPKPGHVFDEEVAMTTYQLDTAASAIVLFEKTESRIVVTNDGRISKEYERYVRYKVLKEAGKDIVDYKLAYDRNENLGSISVATYNMEGGKVKKTKLERKYIFREKITDDDYQCSFSAPDVRVGSVVEVSYRVSSPYYYDIPTLQLQRTIPINKLEASFSYPDFISVRRMSRGYIVPHYQQETYPLHLEIRALQSCNMVSDIYTMEDVPALVHEPSCYCPGQYNCNVSYTISQVVIPGFVYENVSQRWGDVDKMILNSRIATQCRPSGRLVAPFISKADDEETAIVEVCNAVNRAVKFNDTYSMYPKELKTVLKDGVGNSASINALVASTLNEMGYRAYPVLLRKRSSGFLLSSYVRPDAFTSMILQVVTPSGKTHFFDAADIDGYLDVIDPNYLVEDARVIPIDGTRVPYWVNLTSLAKNTTSIVAHAKLDEDGIVKGDVSLAGYNGASYLIKSTRHRLGSDEDYIEFVGEGEDMEIVSYELDSLSFSPSYGFILHFEQVPTAGGEFLYINPFLLKTMHESDFPEMERHMPVEFPTREVINYRYQFEIPEGYEVAELPAPVALRSDVIKGRVLCQSSVMGNSVILQYSFKKDALMADASGYEDLRAFWGRLCNIYKLRIVLKKI